MPGNGIQPVHVAESGESYVPAGRRSRYAQLAVFGSIAVILIGSLLWTLSVVGSAFHTMATGEGEDFLHEIRALQMESPPLSGQALRQLIERHRAEGLRCIALFDHDGDVLAREGDCVESQEEMESLGRSLRPGGLADRGERMVVVHHIPPPSNAPLRRGSAVSGVEPPHSGDRDFLLEFIPVQALALRRAVRRSLVAGLLASAALLVVTIVFWRLSLRSERRREAMERDRMLHKLGEMSAVLVHEIRNPLASLKGHAQLLLESLPREDRAHERAAWVVRESVRLERLCEDLLGVFRSNRLDRIDIAPATVLREAVDSIGDPRIEVDASGAPPRWSLDPARMQEVLGNLLRNALQAGEDQAPDRRQVKASVRRENGRLLFAVRDFGAGVPAGDEERIFEPFLTTKVRGTGLGLAVARRIVELHGGSITVRNQAGGGAEFRIAIPPPVGK